MVVAVLVLLVLLEVVFLVLCFLAFLAGAVLVESGVVWLGAGVDCAKVSVAAANAIASKLFFISISPCGIIFPTTPSSGRSGFNTIDSRG